MEDVVEFPDIGFGEERRHRRSSYTMMSMFHGSEHGLGGIEVRYGPLIFIPLLSHLSTINIIEIWVIDVDCVRGDTDYWTWGPLVSSLVFHQNGNLGTIFFVEFLDLPDVTPLFVDVVVELVPGCFI